jgi:hypothetical protein
MQNTPEKLKHIKGWGIDIDPKNDPTYPIKHRNDGEQEGYSWDRPTQQPVNIEVLHSIERPNISAVYGTSVPPSGLSGTLRRFAFQYSENRYRHWLPLLLADRVNMIEGVVDDIKRGHFPNIFVEKGYKAEWKHNPTGLVTKLAVGGLITYALIKYLTSSSDDD